MQIDPEKITKASKGFRFPWWAGLIVFIVFGGYAGIKQWNADSPNATPKKSDAEDSVRKYAQQLADRNKITIVGNPRYDPEHPAKLIYYSTSNDSTIMCSLKNVECFYNPKKPAAPGAKE
jgi:hypothetical protein